MKTVFDALYAKFTGSALSTAIGGRYYPIEAPVNSLVPLVVASIIAETYRYELNHRFVDVLIEISVYATDAATMHTVADLVFALYDESTLSGLSGWQQVGTLERDSSQPIIEDGVYRYVIEYRLTLKNI